MTIMEPTGVPPSAPSIGPASFTRCSNIFSHSRCAGRCDPILPKIPATADLLATDVDLELVRELLHAAVQVRGVMIAVATKVLHRKRRNLIPMLDGVVLKHYYRATGHPEWLQSSPPGKANAAEAALVALRAFADDLRAVRDPLDAIRGALAEAGFPLTPVRTLEILAWTETEPNGYYRR